MNKKNKAADLRALSRLAKKKLREIKEHKDRKNPEELLDQLKNIK